MKSILCAILLGGVSVSGLKHFGPKHCISVYKKQETGTCVIETNCKGINLDNVEFAFTCQLPNMLQKHSFGKGGFDANESFDTSVKCDECGIPQEVTSSLEKSKKEVGIKKTELVVEKEKDVVVEKVTFGPNGCVSTWLKADKEKK